MIVFSNGLDIRTRDLKAATVAGFMVGEVMKYVVIGTDYGHIHTTGGDVRDWDSKKTAMKFAKSYEASR